MVTIGVSAVLAAAGMGVLRGSMEKAKLTREIIAGRNLITAYQSAAVDNDGRFLPGMDYTVNSVWFEPDKKNITTIHVPHRYPYRLAPYFDYRLEGTILVNDNKKQINQVVAGEYGISTFPTFGMNYYFVGGLVTASGAVQFPGDCVTRSGQGIRSVLVFASGGSGAIDGYNILTPPRLYAQNWSAAAWSKSANPGNWGNVDARYDGKAVCVFLDGSVQLKTIQELRDMRLWSRMAAELDDPNYVIAP